MNAEFVYGYRKTAPQDVTRAHNWINRAQRINPNSDFIHLARAYFLALYEGPIEDAERAARRSVELNPNYSLGYCCLAQIQNFAGDYQNGLANVGRAIEADRRHPYLHMFHLTAGLAHFGLQEFENAEQALALSNQSLPDIPATLMARATNSWHRGGRDQARELVEQLSRLEPGIRLSIIQLPPFRQHDVAARYADGLRKAGLPE